MRRMFLAALLLTLFMPAGALAGPAQTSDKIVKFFADQVDLGQSRGICVGTQAQCADSTQSKPAAGLDMLVNFDLNSARLTPDARAKLEEFVKALQDNRLSQLHFVVAGYTDASGSERYNEDLSVRRAQSVMAFLLENGVKPARLKAVGFGETHPRVADPYDPVNRRVEMRLNSTTN